MLASHHRWLLSDIDGQVPAGRLVTMPYRAREKVPRPLTRKRARAFATLVRHPLMAVAVGSAPVVTALIVLALADPKASGAGAVLLVPAIVVGVSAVRTVRARLWLAALKKVRARPAPEFF